VTKSDGSPSRRRRSSVGTMVVYSLVAAGAVMLLMHQGGGGPANGELAPAFSLRTAHAPERHVTLQSMRGHPVLVEVFASWCPGCRRAAPMMAELYRHHGGDRVRFVGISVDEDVRLAKKTASDWRMRYPVLVDDGSFSRDYRIQALPTFIAIDVSGRVRHVLTGVPSKTRLEAWLRAL
jgi:thiol-disulfide isomerase/thioredoxin